MDVDQWGQYRLRFSVIRAVENGRRENSAEYTLFTQCKIRLSILIKKKKKMKREILNTRIIEK